MDSRKHLLFRGGKKGWLAKNALLYDTFSTDDAAPITSPRTCEPGPGTLTIVDTGNNAALTNGDFKVTGIAGVGDPRFVHDLGLSGKTAGIACYAEIKNAASTDLFRFGFDTSNNIAPNNGSHVRSTATAITAQAAGGTGAQVTFATANNTAYKHLIVHRNSGFLFVIDGELIWVDYGDTSNADWVDFAPYSAASGTYCSEVAAFQLADYNSAWGGDWSEVTDTKTNPASDTTFDCAADCHFNMTVTVEDTNAVRIRVRYTDGDNYFELFLDTDRTVRLRNTVGGSIETLHTTAALTDATSYEFDLILNGSAYSLFIDKVLTDSGSVSNAGNNLVTGGVITHTLDTNDIVLTTHPYPALGIATSRVVCPQDNGTSTMSANAVVEMKNIVLPSSGLDYVLLRWTDASNFVGVYFADDGSVSVKDIVSGSPTDKITAGAGTVSNADDIVVVLDGANAELFVAGTSAGTTSSLTNQTGTTVNFFDLLGGMTFDHIAFFPRDVSSLLPSEVR